MGSVYALDNGPSENTIFSGSSDKFIALWNLKTLQAEKFAARFPAIIYTICHIPEKKKLLVGTSAGSIHIVDLNTMQEIKILQHHTAPIFDYSLFASNKLLLHGRRRWKFCNLFIGGIIITKDKKIV